MTTEKKVHKVSANDVVESVIGRVTFNIGGNFDILIFLVISNKTRNSDMMTC